MPSGTATVFQDAVAVIELAGGCGTRVAVSSWLAPRSATVATAPPASVASAWTVTVPRRCAFAAGDWKTTVGGCPSLRASAAPMSKRAGPLALPAAGRTDSPK